MILVNLLNFFKFILNFIINSLCLYNFKSINLEILYKSHNYLIVNKPEDVFINNHNKEVSVFTNCKI